MEEFGKSLLSQQVAFTLKWDEEPSIENAADELANKKPRRFFSLDAFDGKQYFGPIIENYDDAENKPRIVEQAPDPTKLKDLMQLFPSAKRPFHDVCRWRRLPLEPIATYDLPTVVDDFYLHLLHWGESDLIAMGCGSALEILRLDEEERLLTNVKALGRPTQRSPLAGSRELTPAAGESSTTTRTPRARLPRSVGTDDDSFLNLDQAPSFLFPPVPVSMNAPAPEAADYTSLQWAPKGRLLGACRFNTLEIWDVEQGSLVLSLNNRHSQRIGVMDWLSDSLLTTGSRDRSIITHDLREPQRGGGLRFDRHKQEICGLRWRPQYSADLSAGSELGCEEDGLKRWGQTSGDVLDWQRLLEDDAADGVNCETYSAAHARSAALKVLSRSVDPSANKGTLRSSIPTLASGGNDNRVYLWELGYTMPVAKLSAHQAAVKALAWAPRCNELADQSVLATGGGTHDRTIRLWDLNSDVELAVIPTESQLCNLAWSPTTLELISSHGYTLNQVNIWAIAEGNSSRCGLKKLATLVGHSNRVLYMSPNAPGTRVATAAGEANLKVWDCVGS